MQPDVGRGPKLLARPAGGRQIKGAVQCDDATPPCTFFLFLVPFAPKWMPGLFQHRQPPVAAQHPHLLCIITRSFPVAFARQLHGPFRGHHRDAVRCMPDFVVPGGSVQGETTGTNQLGPRVSYLRQFGPRALHGRNSNKTESRDGAEQSTAEQDGSRQVRRTHKSHLHRDGPKARTNI